jgi:hypothetical protein
MAADRAQFEHAGPHVSPRAKQAETSPALPRSGAQGNPGRAVHDMRRINRSLAGHGPSVLGSCDNATVTGRGTSSP